MNFNDEMKRHGVQIYRIPTGGAPWLMPCSVCGTPRTTIQCIAENQRAVTALKGIAIGETFRGGQGGLVAYFCQEHVQSVDVSLLAALHVEALFLRADEDEGFG